ncbi:MAG TPA: histidine--tRNA ligase [Solirubrobacteraceae bacterium]|nr:histidine--tRNA ligase [Solirubrobacteraceae bacterium]
MSGERIKAPRGTFDVLGEQAAARAALEARARSILEGAGYERIETPAFEATELFARGVGSSTDIVQKEMYTLTDGSGRSLTLRPEGTAPVCRAYVEHGMHKLPQPVKLWYLSSFFRYERAQAGRHRQFWQVGAEALGSQDPALDAESIVLLGTLLEETGVRDVRLRLSSLGSSESRLRYRERLQAHLRANERGLSEEVRERIELNPLRAFDSTHEGTIAVMRDAPRLLDELDADDAEHFAAVRELLDRAGVAYEVDPTLVRGLDYYTRTVFEFTSDALGAQSGVGGGGRYDGLVERLGGPATPAMGWAAGIERILLAGSPPAAGGQAVDLYVGLVDSGEGDGSCSLVQAAAFGILSEARSAGLTAQMEMAGRSLKGQLGHANRVGTRFVAIVGERETLLKDMQDGGQETLDTGKVVHAVLRRLRELA